MLYHIQVNKQPFSRSTHKSCVRLRVRPIIWYSGYLHSTGDVTLDATPTRYTIVSRPYKLIGINKRYECL